VKKTSGEAQVEEYLPSKHEARATKKKKKKKKKKTS
jgi:hypothetical protein